MSDALVYATQLSVHNDLTKYLHGTTGTEHSWNGQLGREYTTQGAYKWIHVMLPDTNEPLDFAKLRPHRGSVPMSYQM